MALPELRARHPNFIYESYKLEEQAEDIRIVFQLKLDPDIVFQPEVVIPGGRKLEEQSLSNLAFHLGMIESISYWKAACPQNLLVEAGNLSDQQIAWWHDLFIHGLGEFFFQNNIDFTPEDFLNILPNRTKPESQPAKTEKLDGDLILVGGGKDSAVTLDVLKSVKTRKGILILNPIQSALDIARQSEYPDPLVVQRKIDPKLIELNESGYLNGHTPFSAYLAFLGVFVGLVHGYENIIVSNERSSGEANIEFKGLEVNHQYSKSYRFERLFREYCSRYLTSDSQYFSFLRPLYDLQISSTFARLPKYHSSFRSCNVGQKENAWCGSCAKCSFVYVSLFPFVPYDKLTNIFGSDLFTKPATQKYIRDLAGLGQHKPFDCVGTIDETRLAVALSARKYRTLGNSTPPFVESLEKDLGISEDETIKMLEKRITNEWDDENFLPPDYARLLRSALQKIQN